jgi:hypothetical protein
MDEFTSISVRSDEKARFDRLRPEGYRQGAFVARLLEQYEQDD